MRLLARLMSLTLLIAASSCHTTSGYIMTPSPPRRAEVAIDMTSGLPPPSWTMAQAEIETLEQMLGALSTAAAVPLFDGLGYRGFVITADPPKRLIRVQNGYVQIEENGALHMYTDTDKQLEQWLVNKSQPHIEPQLYSFLKGAVGR